MVVIHVVRLDNTGYYQDVMALVASLGAVRGLIVKCKQNALTLKLFWLERETAC